MDQDKRPRNGGLMLDTLMTYPTFIDRVRVGESRLVNHGTWYCIFSCALNGLFQGEQWIYYKDKEVSFATTRVCKSCSNPLLFLVMATEVIQLDQKTIDEFRRTRVFGLSWEKVHLRVPNRIMESL